MSSEKVRMILTYSCFQKLSVSRMINGTIRAIRITSNVGDNNVKPLADSLRATLTRILSEKVVLDSRAVVLICPDWWYGDFDRRNYRLVMFTIYTGFTWQWKANPHLVKLASRLVENLEQYAAGRNSIRFATRKRLHSSLNSNIEVSSTATQHLDMTT